MDKIIKTDLKALFSDERKRRGIEKYADILRAFPTVDVSSDKEFQKKFNGFYRVRRNAEWQKAYYFIMERGKTTPLTFESVLTELYTSLGRVEASFTSKLIHTLYNDMPIWDRFVLDNLGLKMPICKGEKKLQTAILLYNQIVKWYDNALATPEIQQKLMEFDELFPAYKRFSKTKKLDFLLWQIRE